jgi:hypothetical protein
MDLTAFIESHVKGLRLHKMEWWDTLSVAAA